jgi:hypothetical protein
VHHPIFETDLLDLQNGHFIRCNILNKEDKVTKEYGNLKIKHSFNYCFAGDILEIGVQWSIECKDIPSFERYMAQLKSYYLDYK